MHAVGFLLLLLPNTTFEIKVDVDLDEEFFSRLDRLLDAVYRRRRRILFLVLILNWIKVVVDDNSVAAVFPPLFPFVS